ncbi:sensor domain-containing diguanylate cyclase [Longirhabdus pacifica]|uniref:sensor domain-containing diguanylate cyclase n=1 Tax=Longirhabdus pacifica TaxID=2305227 RepID=UPI001008C373|nr:sensor domain-containing diguanylate cyclase [Longirhabdus pacifica]
MLKLSNNGNVQAPSLVDATNLILQFASRLHSIDDVEVVINEVFDGVQQLYPTSRVNLYMSQDYELTHKDVKLLSMQDERNHWCKTAFIEGNTVSYTWGNGQTSIAAPLKGKQAVYGVLEVSLTSHDAQKDADTMTMLSNFAGTAFENAKLFEQSNELIKELIIINDILKKLNENNDEEEIYDFAYNELLRVFNADYCCIIDVKNINNMNIRAANFDDNMEDLFTLDRGYLNIVYNTKEAMIISDYSSASLTHSTFMEKMQAESFMAAPIIAQSKVIGVMMLADKRKNFFTYGNYKFFQVITSHFGMAIINASLLAEIQRMVITDNLTNLYERHYFDEQVQQMQLEHYSGGLIVLDIDYFKKINDTYGHQTGDDILKQVSSIIQSSIRETDIAARWGGEEIAIYLPDVNLKQAYQVAERIRSKVMEETTPSVTVSCGVAHWNHTDDVKNAQTLFYNADMALYKAKQAGRNQIRVG